MGFDPKKYGAKEVKEESTGGFDPSKYGAVEVKKKDGGSESSPLIFPVQPTTGVTLLQSPSVNKGDEYLQQAISVGQKRTPLVQVKNTPQEEVVEAEITSGGSNKLDWRERLNENLKTAEDRFSGTQEVKPKDAPLAKTYKPKVDLLAETEMRAREKAIEQNKRDINDNIVFDTEVVAFDPERPSDSKYRNNIYQANVLLDKALPELQKLGFGNVTKEQLLSSPENYGKINEAISAYYDNEIDRSKELVISSGGASPTTGVSTTRESMVDTDETRRLRSEKQDVINKVLKPLYSSIVAAKNPTATSQVIGKEIMKVFSPKDYEALKLDPNLMRQGYDADYIGYNAKLENLSLRAESGQEVQQEANKILSERDNLEYSKYPEIRKNKIRMLVMENLANKGELGGMGDMAPTKALAELRRLAANPPDRRDVPLIQQMIDDLDIRVSGDMSIAERDKTRETWYKEAMQYKNQGIVDRYLDGLSDNSSAIVKGVASIFKSDKTKLGEIDLEEVSTRKYVPSSFKAVAPEYVIDTNVNSKTYSQPILNPKAGEFNLSAVPYASAEGLAQLTIQLVGAELTGGLASGLAKGAGVMGVGTGVIGKAAMANTKLFMPSFLMTFDQNSKQALEIFGAGDDAVFKRLTYSYVTSALEGATEKIGNVYDQLGLSSVLKGEVKDQIAQNIGKLSLAEIKKLGKDELQQKVSKVIAASFGAVKGVGKDLGQETIEELANNVGEFLTSALLDQSSVENRDLFEELRHTAQETFASMAFLGVKGAVGGAANGYSNSSLTKGSLYGVATRPNEARDAVFKMKQAGDISQAEANEKLFIVNAAEKAKQNWDVAKPLVRGIVGNDDKAFNNLAQQFVQARANEIALQKEIDKDGVGDAVKATLQKQVGKWQKVQEFVLNKRVYFDDMGNPSLVPVTVGNMVEVQAKTEEGETDVMFVPVDENGKVKPIETGGVSVTMPTTQVAAETTEAAPEAEPEKRRLAGRLAKKKDGEEPPMPPAGAAPAAVVEETEAAPVDENKAAQAAAEKNLATKLADLAKWRDEQNAAIRKMYQDSPDPDAWVEPYTELAKEYDRRIAEVSREAAGVTAMMPSTKADMPTIKVGGFAAESAAAPTVAIQLPARNDDFVRQYMTPEEQSALEGKTPEQKAEIIKEKRVEVQAAAAPTVSPVADKKADIERRRNEELSANSHNLIAKTELYEDGDGSKYLVHTLEDGRKRLDSADDEGKRTVTNDIYDGSVPVENYIFGAKKIRDKDVVNTAKEKINAKYDAELKALEGKPAAAPTVSETPNIEAKKADIEKRRTIELKENESEILSSLKVSSTQKGVIRDIIKKLRNGTIIKISNNSSQRSNNNDFFKTTTDYFRVENGGVVSIGQDVENVFYDLSDATSFAFKGSVDILESSKLDSKNNKTNADYNSKLAALESESKAAAPAKEEAPKAKAAEKNEPIAATPKARNRKEFNVKGKTVFYHASENKRQGRLKPSNAKQFGTGVYFSTNKKLVEEEFGEGNTTEVTLNVENPVYTNTKEWYKVESLAIELADNDYGKKKGLKLEGEDSYFMYDKDNLSDIDEIPSKFISDAAKQLGYDAIIDEGSNTYENEIVVLDESKINYKDEAAAATPKVNQPTPKDKPKAATETKERVAEAVQLSPASVGEGRTTGTAAVLAKLNIAPFFSIKVNNKKEAESVIATKQYNDFKKAVSDIAKMFGVKIVSLSDGIGGFGGISEATTEYVVSGKWEDIVDFVAVMGALTPEVQEATIASRYVKPKSKEHNADRVEFKVSDETLAKEALAEAGFETNGYTLIGGSVILVDLAKGEEYHDAKFSDKLELLIDKLKEKGVKYAKPKKSPIQFKYIGRNSRSEILAGIGGYAIRQQQSGAGFRDVITEAKRRNDQFVRERTEQEKQRASDTGNNEQVGQDEGGSGTNAEQSVLEENKSAETQNFFTQVEEGKHRPNKPLQFVLPLTKALNKIHDLWDRFKGYFDEHIETNIPVFREIQLRKIDAISKMLSKGGRIIDLGGSTGAFGKTITSINPRIKSVNLDANEKMQERHNTVPVKGADFARNAFLEGFDDVEAYKPEEKFDVVHESMLFQFIGWERGQFIDEIADNYVKENGIVILEEKLANPLFDANEVKKDQDFKLKYYDQKYIDKKKDEVLVGMKKNQASQLQLEVQLARRFKYVAQYWDGGNFKGYVASNSQSKINQFLGLVGDTTSEFSSTKVSAALQAGTKEVSSTPKDGEIISYPTRDGKSLINYFLKDGKWHFRDTKGREVREVESKQGDITAYWQKVRGDKMYDVAHVMPIETEDDVERYVDKARQVLTAIFPDAELVVYNTEAEYEAAGGTPNTRGVWNPRNNQVSLNLERMKAEKVAKTPVHEVIHPIVRAAVLADPELENRLVKDIERFSDVKGVDLVFAHASRYAGRPSYGEEVITEFYTRVADGSIDLNKVSKDIGDRIMDVWNAIADALAKVIPAAANLKVKTLDELKNMASAVKMAFDKGDVSNIQRLLGTQRGKFYGVAMQEQADRIDQLATERAEIERKAKADGTWLKAPNGKPTNLTAAQWVTVRTDNFLNWFGDWLNDPENASKVIDSETGEPKVMYHGTDVLNDYSTFNRGDIGFHFGNIKQAEDRLANNMADTNARIYSTFLNIKNPIRLIDRGGFFPRDIMFDLVDLGIIDKSIESNQRIVDKKYVLNALKAKGYDGVVYLNREEGYDYGKRVGYKENLGEVSDEKFLSVISEAKDSFIAFESNQVKSAISNIGSFSPESASILQQLAPEFEQDIADILEEFPDATLEEIMEEVEASRPELVATDELRAETEKRVAAILSPTLTPLQKAIKGMQAAGAKGKKFVAKTKQELAKVMESVFGLNEEKAEATAEIAHLLIAAEAKLNGISVAEQYRRYAFAQAEGAMNEALYQQFAEPSDFDENGKLRPEVAAEIAAERAEIERKAKADGTWMKAPNGKPTNLNEAQYVTVRTKRFKNWFRGSKVVDENGEPKVVYHGTPKYGFEEFKEVEGGTSKSKMQLLFGSHFASTKDDASIYTKNKGGIYESFLSLQNPINLSDGYVSKGDKNFDAYVSLAKELGLDKKFKNTFDYDLFTEKGNFGGKSKDIQRVFITQLQLDQFPPKKVGDALKKNGFDGVIYDPYKSTGINQISKYSQSYISFQPNQIKSATANIGTFSPNTGNILYQAEAEKKISVNGKELTVKPLPEGLAVVNGFYSPIEKRILEFKQPTASATKWKEIVGTKEEAKFTGVAEWLDTKKPNEQVSKADVLAWMRDNRIEVVEVVKGGKQNEWSDDWVKTDNGFTNGAFRLFKGNNWKLYNNLTNEEIGIGGFDNLEGAKMRAKDEWDRNKTDTKFAQYQLEGDKTNYREVLVTLPQSNSEEATKRLAEKYDTRWANISKAARLNNIEELKEIGLNDAEIRQVTKNAKPSFTSSHFDEPNILVHLRMNSRQAADGSKTLFLEEIQSDFNTAYRKSQDQVIDFVSKNEAQVIELYKKSGKLRVEC